MVIRLHRWVVWWFFLGVLGGAIAIPNIIFRNLTHLQETVLLCFGVVHWLLGGFVCWAWEGVKLARNRQSHDAAGHTQLGKSARDITETEENVLSELMAHQDRPISPRHSRLRQEILTIYLLRHRQHHS